MEGYLTVTEYAKQIGRCTRTVYRMLWAGKLQAVKVGRTWAIPVSSLPRE